MSIAFTAVGNKRSVGARYVSTGDLALDNAYPAGGYVVSAALFKHRNTLTAIDTAITAAGFISQYLPATSKLKFFKVGAAGALTECATTDLNADTIRLHVTGK